MQRLAKPLSITLSLTTILLVILAGTHVQAIGDWYRLRGYIPPANIVSIANQDAMTDYAKHVLFVTHPVLETNGTTFQSECPQGEQSIVLGCYRSGISPLSTDSTLSVYDVRDPRLAGVQQVTTAHEMLHAAYDRLSSSQRNKLDTELVDYYNHGLKDQRVLDTIAAYKTSEPNDVINEMHSIFGTEVGNLPVSLENYYKQYFTSRQAVVAFAGQYEGEFTNRTNQINADDQKLAQLRQNIQAEEQSLQSQNSVLNSDRARVERSDDQSTINDYNAKVATYNSGVRRLQNDIAAYNSLVEQRNALASELRSLQSSLDSRLTTQSAQ
jgi:hypothetical protein